MQNIGDSAPVMLPIDFDMRPKNTVPPCKSRKVNVLPLSGGTFNPGDIAKFEVPVGRKGEFLDGTQTYLLFKVKNTDTANIPIFVDHSCASFISKLEVFSSSQLIETINCYNELYSVMMDTQYGPLDRQSFQTIVLGCDQDAISDNVNFQRGGISIAQGATQTFALPLFSGVVGSGLSKYLPIGDLQDLRVEITWENNANAVISATTTPISTNIWQVTSAELAIQVISVDGSVHDMMASSRGNAPIMLSSETYRNYNTVLNAGQSSDSTIAPLKFTSVKSLFGAYRLATNQNNLTAASISSRRNPFASSGASAASVSLQLLMGNNYVPQIPMRTTPEIFTEYSKAWHTLGNVNNKTVLNKSTYDNSAEPNAFGQYVSATSATGNLLTVASTAGLYVNAPIYFYGTAAGNVVLGTTYYVQSIPSTTTFTIASTIAGTQFTLATVTPTANSLIAMSPNLYWQNTPSFVWGVNCDTLYQQSQNSMSGTNTQAGNCFINATYSANTPAGGQRFDVYAHYDFILIIDPSTKQMSIRI